MNTLALSEQVAQMVVVRASGYLFDHQIRYPIWEPPVELLKGWLQDLGVGGVIFVDGSAVELSARIQQLQSWARFPLLLAADIEEGVGQRFSGATWFPPPMALGAIANTQLDQAKYYAEQMGAITAQEAVAIGLNWILAPVVDVNNNPQNPVINIRSFGETPEIVSQLATAFIQGCQHYPVLTTAKHFPGHGDTAVDSHWELPILPHGTERLMTVELPPFQAAIQAKVDAVMSAHLLISAWDRVRPATLSAEILTGQLRQTLGFEGLIVTDALVMGAIANQYSPEEAAILAVEAGADILLMPLDPEVTIQAVCHAVEQGRITPERIQASVQRILQAKTKVCPNWTPFNPIINTTQPAFTPEPLMKSQGETVVSQILKDSGQSRGVLSHGTPNEQSGGLPRWNLIIVDSLLEARFLDRQTPAIALPAQWGYDLHLIDCHTPCSPSAFDSSHPPTLVQVFVRGNPFRSSTELTKIAQTWVKGLLSIDRLLALVVYGSPYVMKQFALEIPSDVPCVFSYGQISIAQKVSLERLFGL
ncbi:MAG: glycoside hydrolase family 3 N-terminal domain-containing protein [Microcoleaceae cyanobacterium]